MLHRPDHSQDTKRVETDAIGKRAYTVHKDHHVEGAYLLCQNRFRKLHRKASPCQYGSRASVMMHWRIRTCPTCLRCDRDLFIAKKKVRQRVSVQLRHVVKDRKEKRTVHAVDHAGLDGLASVFVEPHDDTPGDGGVCGEPRLVGRFGLSCRPVRWRLRTGQERCNDSRRRIQHNLHAPRCNTSVFRSRLGHKRVRGLTCSLTGVLSPNT